MEGTRERLPWQLRAPLRCFALSLCIQKPRMRACNQLSLALSHPLKEAAFVLCFLSTSKSRPRCGKQLSVEPHEVSKRMVFGFPARSSARLCWICSIGLHRNDYFSL